MRRKARAEPNGRAAACLPDGWTWHTLGDLCRQDRCLVEPNSGAASRLPYLGLEDIEGGTGAILRDPSAPHAEDVRSVTFQFDARHVLYGKLRPYLNKVALPDFTGRCTTELIPLLPGPGVSREYLSWLLRRPETVRAAMRQKVGARMPRADIKYLLSLQVPVPDTLEEQERLARDIATRFAGIAAARRACREQLELLDVLAGKLLSVFPLPASETAGQGE
jgi:type I restriction enzyme, S subunit